MRSRHRRVKEQLKQEVVVRKYYQNLATERLHEVERLKYLLKQVQGPLGAGPSNISWDDMVQYMIRGAVG
jgi:hypothetical protein